MTYDFSNEVVLVTGAARGLGRAIATAFAASNATVALGDIDKTPVIEAAQAIGKKAHAYALDVSVPESVQKVVQTISREIGSISILVNNAAICSTEQFLQLDAKQFNRMLAVNLTGAFLCMQAVVRGMIQRPPSPSVERQNRGKIINIGSLAGRSGGIMVSASYSASKAGLAGLSKATAKQLAQYHINVNCIAPGTLETELISGWDPEKIQTLRKNVPWGRLGTVDDVVGAVLFLASPASDYITGATLDINGGLYIAP
jgi:3-oxoacyl-[acyl-carrier protein] reductase